MSKTIIHNSQYCKCHILLYLPGCHTLFAFVKKEAVVHQEQDFTMQAATTLLICPHHTDDVQWADNQSLPV